MGTKTFNYQNMKQQTEKIGRYRILQEGGGLFLAHTENLQEAEKMLLSIQRTQHFVKLVDFKLNKTLLSVS